VSRLVPARAVIFDFNGTLSHDEPILCEIYSELFAAHGKPLSAQEYFDELAGLSDPEIVRTWLGADHPDVDEVIEERINLYRERVSDGSSIPESHRAAVRYAAAHVPVAIVSGAARAEIEPVVRAAGLGDSIRAIVAAEDVTEGKPDPAGYRRALAVLDGGRLRGHRGRRRVGEGGRHAVPRRPRDACAGAARTRRRDRARDRRLASPAAARLRCW
jgi:beta-phosphoglucomutase-like phosphatase (HAD superfamily)